MCSICYFVLELGLLHSLLHGIMEILCICVYSSFLHSFTSKRKIFLSAWPHRYRWEPGSLMRKSSTQTLHLEGSLKVWGMRFPKSWMGTPVWSHQTTTEKESTPSARADFDSSTNIKGPLKAHNWKSWKASCPRTTKKNIILIWTSLKSKIPSV